MNKDELFQEDKSEISLSQSEVYFEWWLEELKSAGLVIDFSRGQTFNLIDPLAFDFNQHYKTKEPLIKQVNVLRNVAYTPDYKVLFNKKLLGKLYANLEGRNILDDGRAPFPGNIWQEILFLTTDTNYFSETSLVYFDVKPPSHAIRFSGALGSSRDFPIKQHLMYSVHNIFVNKVIPYGQKECLFTKTFLPKRYLWTDKSTKLRTLKDYEKKARTLTSYLESKSITL